MIKKISFKEYEALVYLLGYEEEINSDKFFECNPGFRELYKTRFIDQTFIGYNKECLFFAPSDVVDELINRDEDPLPIFKKLESKILICSAEVRSKF